MSCKRAQGYLAREAAVVKESVDAGKDPFGPKQALELAKQAQRIVAARGKKVVTLDLKKDRPDDDAILSLLLGPSGKLRAPTIRKGKTLLVGFNDEAYDQVLAGSKK